MWNILVDSENDHLSGRRFIDKSIPGDFKMCRAVLRLVFIFSLLSTISSAPRRPQKIKIDPNYLKALSAYRRLEPTMSRQELKTITTIGILNGAMKAEKEMQSHLTKMVTDLILNTDMSDKSAAMSKITKIEETIERDKNAVQILSSAMDLATKSLTVKEYKEQLQKTLEDHKSRKRSTANEKEINMARLKQNILDHMQYMKKKISTKIDNTLDYLHENKELDMFKINRKRNTPPANDLQHFFAEDKVENNLVVVENQSVPADSGKDVNIAVNIEPSHVVEISGVDDGSQIANQLEESDEGIDEEGGGMPGGLLGLIAGLSGGEGGSDIGALVGALTGVISQIFGPGGLDIESLISTGTSLIAGLLAGNKNFGTVLGEYVGTAFDGLSGGGGAINNGKFIGNLLGTIVASLSADPEDDDLPPKPMVFIQNLIQSFSEAKNRAGSPEGDDVPAHPPPMAGSDSFGFIKQIVSALVGGVTSLVLNASLGASGGSSQASTAALTSSSHPHPAPHKPTW